MACCEPSGSFLLRAGPCKETCEWDLSGTYEPMDNGIVFKCQSRTMICWRVPSIGRWLVGSESNLGKVLDTGGEHNLGFLSSFDGNEHPATCRWPAVASISACVVPRPECGLKCASAAGQTPWHLVDLWWTLPEEVREFESWSMTVEIYSPVPDGIKLYIAPLGICYFGPNKIPTYGGIQTQSDGYRFPELREKGGKFHQFGRGCIFSRWESRDVQDVKVEDGGFWCSGGEEWSGEGNFLSARVPFKWGVGSYTYSLRREDADPSHSWVTAYIGPRDDPTAAVRVGALQFEGSPLLFQRSFASFVEIYGGPTSPDATPEVDILFTDVCINGAALAGRGVSKVGAHYPKDVPQQLHASCIATSPDEFPSVLCRMSRFEVERPHGASAILHSAT